jgi:type VI secretion system protein ImpE
VGFIPTRYAGTETADDSALRLARKTEWTPIGSEAFAGRGQRVLATSADEVPLLEVRELRLTGN